MRMAGFISDYLGEPRVAEFDAWPLGIAGMQLEWYGGRTRMGGPLGMPLGVDPGIAFQVYVNEQFEGHTAQNSRTVRIEPERHNWCEVIPVASHLGDSDQHHVCTHGGGDIAELSWPASSSTDVIAYRIYHDSKSGTVSYGTTYATVPAKRGGVVGTTYTYRAGRLSSGTWKFGIRAVDAAGNVQTSPTMEQSCTIARVPDPPSALARTYHFASKKATLTWTVPSSWT